MIPSTTHFAGFIKAARSNFEVTQDGLHGRGAPYRQMQGKIENAELPELDEVALQQYDHAYGWPRGYAAAVAQCAAYWCGELVSDALADHPDRPTLAAQYEPECYCAPATLGFDPSTGDPVTVGRPLLTNIAFADLRGIVDSRSGPLLLDVNVTDERCARAVAAGELARERRRVLYRTAAGEGSLAEIGHLAEPIAIDPLTGLSTMKEARRLARILLSIYPATATTVERAAFTFMAIAAFGKDPFITITALLTGAPVSADFAEFWRDFRDLDSVDADLAQPDLQACGLIAGLRSARMATADIEIGMPHGHPRTPRYTRPRTVRADELVSATNDSVVFYDSLTAPETPVCVNSMGIGAAMTIYRFPSEYSHTSSRGVLCGPMPDPDLMVRSIGIASDVDDLSILARHEYDRLATLTNLFGRYAVYSNDGTASVVWLPYAG